MQSHLSLNTLPSRYLFINKVEQSIDEDRAMALCLLDVMRFSDVSSTFDHIAGDQLLLQIANKILDIFGDEIILGRISGDIFGIIVYGKHDEKTVYKIYQRLVEHFKTPLMVNDLSFIADFNVGATFRASNDEQDANLFISLAEAALKQSKSNKHENFAFLSNKKDKVQGRALTLKADLTRALANDELELYFQPKVDLRNLRILSCEALLRWNHPLDGVLFPGALIQAAETYNMMNVLGHWTIDFAAKTLASFISQGVCIPVSINLSPSQLYDPDLIEQITQVLSKYKVPAKYIEIELTEDVALSNSLMVKRQLDGIRALGIAISMDDFGKGYSNLSFIRDLQLNAIKIDKTFIMDLEASPVNEAIVLAAKGIADAKACETVAEGIESVAQLNILKQMGIKCGQGFLFSPAVQADEFIRLCQQGGFAHLLPQINEMANKTAI